MKSLISLFLPLYLLFVMTGCGKKPVEEPVSLSPPPESEAASDTGLFLSISEEYAFGMLVSSLPAEGPFSVEALDFSADSTMKITGKVDLRSLGEANNLPFSSLYPNSIAFSTTGRFTYHKESGVTITPLSLTVLGFEIPLDVLPESLYKPYQEKINQYLDTMPMTPSDLYLTDDAIILLG